jgi:hypothetical protein
MVSKVDQCKVVKNLQTSQSEKTTIFGIMAPDKAILVETIELEVCQMITSHTGHEYYTKWCR